MRWKARALASVLPLALACSQPAEDQQTAEAATPVPPNETVQVSTDESAEKARKSRKPPGKPLPAFGGWTLDDERLEISSLLGKRLVLLFFNPEVKEAPLVAEAVNEVAKLGPKNNFEVVGVATGSDRSTAKRFVDAQGLDFRVIDDSNAEIARRMGLRAPMTMLGVDAEGYVVFGFGQFPTADPKASEVIQSLVRRGLRLPELDVGTQPVLGTRPQAPLFRAAIMDGEGDFDLAAKLGRPVVLVFFLHTCPHCHDLLNFLKEPLASLPEDERPILVGLEISGRTYSVRQELASKGLDYFPVIFDKDGSIQSDYGVFAGVPDAFLIDAQGRISHRLRGWQKAEHGAILRMRLARLAGAPVPMLLRAKGYSGSEVCGVCHEVEHETWAFTNHATAFDTLVRHGEESDAECVSCHVVGFGEPGGFTSSESTRYLENVGCESCHGRGGPHLSPGFVADGNYESRCATCHDEKHSLGFDYATFRPSISHAENAHITRLPLAEKRRLMAERGRPGGDLLSSGGDYVGSAACKTCHSAEHTTWFESPHAAAVRTLIAKREASNADCLRCHTTGFGRPGGFPEGGDTTDHSDLAGVGCESCHGPGGDHVKDGATKIGSIVSLGDKCDSCVILQICGSCHDETNDPGFEFEVVEKIEKQRHGTIEAGTGKTKGSSAGRTSPAGAIEAELARAFDRLRNGS